MANNIKILIADDHPLVREGIKTILQTCTECEFEIETCSNGIEVMDIIIKKKLDLLLLDISMPIIDGFEVLSKIRNEMNSSIPILMLTSHNNPIYLKKAIELGASGYMLKQEEASVLIQAIHKILDQEKFYSAQIQNLISANSNPIEKQAIDALSWHQKQILALIVQEKTSQQIADQLFLSIRTIEGHRKRLMEKLNLNSTIGLVKFAIKNGLE